MSRKNIILTLIVAVVVIGVFLLLNYEKIPSGSETVPNTSIEGQGQIPVSGEGEEEVTPSIPEWQNPEKPSQSAPMSTDGDVPSGTVKMTVTASGFDPSSFEVKAGKEVSLSITSGDQWTHIFKFKDGGLSDIAVGIGPGITRVITFYAPEQKGSYEYYCDVPGHEARGEKGEMIVK